MSLTTDADDQSSLYGAVVLTDVMSDNTGHRDASGTWLASILLTSRLTVFGI